MAGSGDEPQQADAASGNAAYVESAASSMPTRQASVSDAEGSQGAARFLKPPARKRPPTFTQHVQSLSAGFESKQDAYGDEEAAHGDTESGLSEPGEPEEEPLLQKREVGGNILGSRIGNLKRQRQLDLDHGEQWEPLSFVQWFALLREQYGSRLLLLLFSSQHLIKGVVQQLQASAVMWLLREYSVTGPQMQIYLSVASSAWALKPIIGAVSDVCPIFGFRKAPYVVITSLVGVTSATLIGLSTRETMSVFAIVLCLFGMSLQASTCDLLTEAKYSEHLQDKPAFGPDLITYVWGGISIGNMVAIALVGWLITTMGSRSVFLACVFPSAAILCPTFANYFEETRLGPRDLQRVRAAFFQQGEVLFLCALMTVLTAFLSAVGAMTDSHRMHCLSALIVLAILLPCFQAVLRPEIAKVNCFFVLQAALSLNIGGATFYFYTDKENQYPDGPHFSAWFFASTLGLVASFMSLIGLATYTRYMKDWSYQGLLLFTNVLVTVLSLLDAVMFKRLNVRMGIPDTVFVLGSSVSTVVIRQWQWMPGVVVMSQLCPVGMEATMFALLAGCSNIGSQISDYLGAYTLDVLDIHPSGAAGEGAEFDNLWKASCISTLLPAVTIALIPALIPSARQTDKLLLSDASSATVGSPWSRWRAYWAASAGSHHEGAGSGVGHVWDIRRPGAPAGTVPRV